LDAKVWSRLERNQSKRVLAKNAKGGVCLFPSRSSVGLGDDQLDGFSDRGFSEALGAIKVEAFLVLFAIHIPAEAELPGIP
jgi:hypothetical protein